MERQAAAELLSACQGVLEQATQAEKVILGLPAGEERSRLLRALAELVATVHMSLRSPVVREHPELEQQEELPDEPDTSLEPEEEAYVNGLDAVTIAEVDEKLLAECSTQWRKAARVIGATMGRAPEIPLGFFARRLIALGTAGRLEIDGDLNYIRFSEVRLPGGSAA